MSDLKYNPYSKNLKCKWCGNKIMDHAIDLQCNRCWEVLTRIPDVCRIPELFKEIKKLVEKRDDEIRKEENVKEWNGENKEWGGKLDHSVMPPGAVE